MRLPTSFWHLLSAAAFLFTASAYSADPKTKAADSKMKPAAAAPVKRVPPKTLPGSPVELKTKDGWTIAAVYMPAKPDQQTIVLLHQNGGRKEDWYFLAKALVKEGFGVMAIDLRGHGGSTSAPEGQEPSFRKFRVSRAYSEYNNMIQEIEAAVDFLKLQNVDETTIALGGAAVGSSLALRYAALHKVVPFVFMLSPGMTYSEVITVNALRAYGKRPILMIVGADDRNSMKQTPILFEFAKVAAGAENVTLITVDREHGAKMLARNKGLTARIVSWIKHPAHEGTAPLIISTDTPLDVGGTQPDENE